MYHTSGQKPISALLILARVDESSAVEWSGAKPMTRRLESEAGRRLSGAKRSEAEQS